MAIADTTALSAIQFAVLELPDSGATFPSGLWTPEEVRTYLTERQNRFLKQTLIQVGVAVTDAGPARSAMFALPADWIATVSVVWQGEDGVIKELIRSDPFAADHGDPTWTVEARTPTVYLDYAQPTLQLQVAPIPNVGGRLEILYVPLGAPFTGTGEIFTLQDEFADAVIRGALADMLAKDGRGKDPARAAYCEGRYQLGVDAARIILDGLI